MLTLLLVLGALISGLGWRKLNRARFYSSLRQRELRLQRRYRETDPERAAHHSQHAYELYQLAHK